MPEARTSGSTAGRKRDPMIEPRVFEAAVRVYARAGWGGFTFDAVAREAGVGKPALYRRWSGGEELLVSALHNLDFPTARDRGSVRADLLDYARQWVHWYQHADRALAGRRISLDSRARPALATLYEEMIDRPRTEAAREVTRRAIARGELPPAVRSSTPADLLVGAMSTHWESTSESSRARLRRTFPAYAETLVDIILTGLQAVPDQNHGGTPGTTA
jgi:AcrR family transcriptional regulator